MSSPAVRAALKVITEAIDSEVEDLDGEDLKDLLGDLIEELDERLEEAES